VNALLAADEFLGRIRGHGRREGRAVGEGDFEGRVAGGGDGKPAAEHGELVHEDAAEPGPEVGEGGAAELGAGEVGRGERVLDEVASPALGPEVGGKLGVGDAEQELAARLQHVSEGVGSDGRVGGHWSNRGFRSTSDELVESVTEVRIRAKFFPSGSTDLEHLVTQEAIDADHRTTGQLHADRMTSVSITRKSSWVTNRRRCPDDRPWRRETSCTMAERRLTPKGQELVSAGRQLKPWSAPGQASPYGFEGDFNHEGVDLSAGEVLSIMADQVFEDAKRWAATWNEQHPEDLFFFAGIEFQGPITGRWWEDKGERKGPLGESRGRYPKFGGIGHAILLTKS
jgi:hypothetical protein